MRQNFTVSQKEKEKLRKKRKRGNCTEEYREKEKSVITLKMLKISGKFPHLSFVLSLISFLFNLSLVFVEKLSTNNKRYHANKKFNQSIHLIFKS